MSRKETAIFTHSSFDELSDDDLPVAGTPPAFPKQEDEDGGQERATNNGFQCTGLPCATRLR